MSKIVAVSYIIGRHGAAVTVGASGRYERTNERSSLARKKEGGKEIMEIPL